MRSSIPSVVLAALACSAPAPADAASPLAPKLTDAVFVRPLYGLYRHCEGACIKSGALSWFCGYERECHLSCATAPPAMRCSAR